MNTDSKVDFDRERLTIKKHLMAFESLRELAIRLMSAYGQLEHKPDDISLWMGIREEEIVFSRLFFYLFGFDVNTSSCKLQDVIAMTAVITRNSNIALNEIFFAVH